MTERSVLAGLTRRRLYALGRELGAPLPARGTREEQAAALASAGHDLSRLLPRFTRDELRAACRAHGLDHRGRAREELMARLLIRLSLVYETRIDVWLSRTRVGVNETLASLNHPRLRAMLDALAGTLGADLRPHDSKYYLDELTETGFSR